MSSGFCGSSVLGALVASWIVILGLSVLWLSARGGTTPVFFKYFSFPFTAVLYQFGPDTFLLQFLAGKTLWGFLTTGVLTTLLLGLPAAFRYARRDISGN